ncbi:MAG: MBL fold metallo-hydrolase [Chloroflexi bacterium]|nr:MBL fold metallo-hydrolase [Chloroflexota bacterium]
MEIIWRGHSCFQIRSGDTTIITDPFSESLGFPLGDPIATIATVSHRHPHHDSWSALRGAPLVIKGAGDYERSNIHIKGINTPRSDPDKQREANTVYMIQVEGINLCHLGDLNEMPSSRQIEELGRSHILFVPAGGVCTLNIHQVAEVINLIDPKMVIPMHYKTEGVVVELETLEPFLKEMGVKEAVPRPRLSVSSSNLPSERQLVVLQRAT